MDNGKIRHGNLKHEPVPLAIVGGGAAGMFAAAVAAERDLGCLVFERKARLGAKMLMTANGRCNFTKDIPVETFLRDVGEPVASWVAPALRSCPPQAIIRGLKSLGVKLRRMEDARMFPDSGQASTIVHAFGDLLRDSGVPLCLNCPVTGIQPVKNGFIVGTCNFTVWAQNVLIATGGLSFPKTGSVGDGQEFARRLGLATESCRAGLTGLEVADPAVKAQAGARFEDGLARVIDSEGRTVFSSRGEVDCEAWGVSGAAVYNAQRYLSRHGARGSAVEVEFGGQKLTIRRIVPRPLKEAIVTIGGVALDEVDNRTMMARKVPGLYFAGEVLDIDGPTGGYNLTLAFATARAAVCAIAARLSANRE
ncbi:MAG: NAD(P)/FAD-dependent oxidoreductase [Kiritimatiellae bacterium]|nr:NAD(P)/FAD-dependent oxidoreductase [Kiritimatiellia bacterium]